jgi:DNA mismatch repair protein PMS2
MNASNFAGATQSAKSWSTQEDVGSRTVRIEGHISRPVVGEGRQTPDRQMFFVNSRPCTLPQVAKAFNEVYKSFNITQSPFIFADIKLDTNAYDVNVSPDKRTIMLHDQTALLEQLKQALLELFESHDQSVPQAQLTGHKPSISASKPPTIQSQDSTMSAVTEDRDIANGMRQIPREPSSNTESPPAPDASNVDFRPGFIKASLIERFAGRDAADRVVRPPARRRRDSLPEHNNAPEERVVQSNGRRRSASPHGNRTNGATRQRSQSPLFEPEQAEALPARLSQPPRIVQDFNARIASQQAQRSESVQSPIANPQSMEAPEEPIPVLKQTPHKPLSQSSIQNAFDRMRPMRTPVQEATITVGGTTTISTIGTGSQSTMSRRARVHTPKFSLSGKPLNQTPSKSLFRKGLSGFAAPGTQLEGSDEEEDTAEGALDSSVLDAPARSPSPRKRLPSRAFEEPQSEDLVKSSSAPQPRAHSVQEEDSDLARTLEGDLEPLVRANGSDDNDSDDEYYDETEKKAREEAKIAQMIAEAEETAARPTEMNLKRANKLFKVTHKKYWTINLEKVVETDVGSLIRHLKKLQAAVDASEIDKTQVPILPTGTQLNQEDPEERLSLTVTKPDFKEMRIIGQFNLGFIIAVRPPTSTSPNSDLFIIDQHASDEKYNFERLSATTTMVSQRLVHPHPLELTAVEEEIILANEQALTANGFIVDMRTADDDVAGHRARLTSLPMSKEVTFTPTDLEELLALILDNPPSSSTSSTSQYIPRPSKVRKLLASRACRSSVMIGKTLQHARMKEIVRHMGSMDKPWSCPHGRPTMRHLYGLEKWQGWTEGDGVTGVDVPGQKADWAEYLMNNKR